MITAVAAERDALAGLGVDVVAGGIGPAAAAAAASALLARDGYDLVLSAGIAGGFAPLRPGEIAVAGSMVFADLGAETGAGADQGADFLPLGSPRYEVAPRLAVELADCTGGHLGTVLTVATVTGTAARAAALRGRYPDAVAEGMEGAGVAAAASWHGVAFGEVRAISNAVGPRDRASWRIPEALAALRAALAAVARGSGS